MRWMLCLLRLPDLDNIAKIRGKRLYNQRKIHSCACRRAKYIYNKGIAAREGEYI